MHVLSSGLLTTIWDPTLWYLPVKNNRFEVWLHQRAMQLQYSHAIQISHSTHARLEVMNRQDEKEKTWLKKWRENSETIKIGRLRFQYTISLSNYKKSLQLYQDVSHTLLILLVKVMSQIWSNCTYTELWPHIKLIVY